MATRPCERLGTLEDGVKTGSRSSRPRRAPAHGRVRIVGVEPERAPTLTRALAAGRPVDAEAGGIAADSLAPRRVAELMFPIARRHVERVLLVSDESIRRAQEALWRVLRIVAEPGGAAALAALLSGGYRLSEGEQVGVLVCGGNTTAVDFDRKHGRPSRHSGMRLVVR
jgi:threonine dehydratase